MTRQVSNEGRLSARTYTKVASAASAISSWAGFQKEGGRKEVWRRDNREEGC